MSQVGELERASQDRIVKLFQEELNYDYLGNWEERENNKNIEVEYLKAFLLKQGYEEALANKAIHDLQDLASNITDSLYTTNKNVYEMLRYGAKVKLNASDNTKTVYFIDWGNPENNDFAIAEEVTIKGAQVKRPDVMLYINGIAIGVLELKRGNVEISEGVRQNITNQTDRFIENFFTTIQLVMAGNDTQGLQYGTIKTSEKFYLSWKEDIEDNSRLLLDKYIIKMCNKERLIDILHDFVLYDGGVKKLPRVHQYMGIKEAQKYVKNYEGGIIWHTQGSGKSITMVLLTKWILEKNPNARVVVLTDRTELDIQIEGVFKDSGEDIYRTKSGRDLMTQLEQPKPRLLCSLIHKFGKKGEKKELEKFLAELKANPVKVSGELFVLVDECHRTQAGTLHKTMRAILGNAVFIGFTGTPLLKKDKKTTAETFGKYIHTYLFDEAVDDGVVLDLVYEARDIDQEITSPDKVELWFKTKTKGLNDFQKAEVKKKWGTMKNLLSSQSRMQKIVADIVFDFEVKARLSSEKGNAILVANSIYEACEYYKLFANTNSTLKGRTAIVTSYNPYHGDVNNEETGENTETEKQIIYNLYEEILKGVTKQGNKTLTECYEDMAKSKFGNEPVNMKLLIVVDKLLTGFDAPTCSYLYIDKSMKDHGLFQAICRTNRLDGDDKDFGYIVDYRDLFTNLGEAIAVYTSELDTESLHDKKIEVTLKDRLQAGKERLDTALEQLHLLCEPVNPPRGKHEYQQYFCGNVEKPEELKGTEVQRSQLYKYIVQLIRAYANVAGELEEAGYTKKEITDIEKERDFYLKLREEIKMASGETIDLKSYEAGMRHLINNFIEAKDPQKISPFDGMSLLEIMTSEGVQAALSVMPEGFKGDKRAIAETIERNVRKKIIEDQHLDPAYFDKMSKLLDELIKKRKADAEAYELYLEEIAELAKRVLGENNEDMPSSMVTVGMKALYNNIDEDEDFVIKLDNCLKTKSPADWRGHTARERKVQEVIYNELKEVHEDLDMKQLIAKVNEVFAIVKEHQEY